MFFKRAIRGTYINNAWYTKLQCAVHKSVIALQLHYTTKFSLFMIPTVPPSPLIQEARDIPGGIHKSLKNQQFQ